MTTLLDGTGHEQTITRSKKLVRASKGLCVEAVNLTEATRAIRATSVSIRRTVLAPSICGGADGLDTDARRRLIRDKLADGRLPVDSIARGVVGQSRGELCDGCGEEVQPPGMVMKGVASLGGVLRFHVDCFYIWDGECKWFTPPPNEAPLRSSVDPRLGPL